MGIWVDGKKEKKKKEEKEKERKKNGKTGVWKDRNIERQTDSQEGRWTER